MNQSITEISERDGSTPVIFNPEPPSTPRPILPTPPSKGPDSGMMLLGLGIAFIVMGTITKWFIPVGVLFLVGWGYITWDRYKKKSEVDYTKFKEKQFG